MDWRAIVCRLVTYNSLIATLTENSEACGVLCPPCCANPATFEVTVAPTLVLGRTIHWHMVLPGTTIESNMTQVLRALIHFALRWVGLKWLFFSHEGFTPRGRANSP